MTAIVHFDCWSHRLSSTAELRFSAAATVADLRPTEDTVRSANPRSYCHAGGFAMSSAVDSTARDSRHEQWERRKQRKEGRAGALVHRPTVPVQSEESVVNDRSAECTACCCRHTHAMQSRPATTDPPCCDCARGCSASRAANRPRETPRQRRRLKPKVTCEFTVPLQARGPLTTPANDRDTTDRSAGQWGCAQQLPTFAEPSTRIEQSAGVW